MKLMNAIAVLGVGIPLGLLVNGCSALNPGTSAAADTAQEFHALLAAGDGETACGLLTSAAVEALEGDKPGSCAESLAELKLNPSSTVTDSRAFGRNAQVQLDGDTVFLTVSGNTWKVTAAGCTSRGERPYDCEVEGN